MSKYRAVLTLEFDCDSTDIKSVYAVAKYWLQKKLIKDSEDYVLEVTPLEDTEYQKITKQNG